MKRIVIVLAAAALIAVGSIPAMATPEVCPSSGGWTKVDSGDLSSYPVDGATDYCFKAGNSNSQGCEGGLFDTWPVEGACGLSHWAFFIPTDTNTPVHTNTPDVTDTATPVSTNTPTPDPDETPTETPVVTDTPDPEVTPTATPALTNTPEPTNTPTPQAPPTCVPENNPIPGSQCTGGRG